MITNAIPPVPPASIGKGPAPTPAKPPVEIAPTNCLGIDTEPMPTVAAKMLLPGPNGQEVLRLVDVSAYGEFTLGRGTLGEVIHQARAVSAGAEHTPWQAQGVFQAETGAFEIRPLRYQAPMETGELLIDPPADAAGYVPLGFQQVDPSLKAVVGASRFATFEGEHAGKMQDIVSGPPGQNYPPTPVR